MAVVVSERHVFTDTILTGIGLSEEVEVVVVSEPHATLGTILAGIGPSEEAEVVVVSNRTPLRI